MMSVEVVLKCVCVSTGEGPHWDERSHSLLYVDIGEGIVHRWNAVTGDDEKYQFDKSVSFVVPCSSGGYIVGLGQSLVRFDWDTKAVTVLHTVDAGKDTRLNDGKCDAMGRLWAGTMGEEKVQGELTAYQGSLYCMHQDGRVTKHKEGVTVSNGMAWTKDNRTMFYIDSPERKVFAYDYDVDTGAISRERTCVDFGDETTIPTMGFPDGMTIDSEEKIWVACYGGAKVIRFDPETEPADLPHPHALCVGVCFSVSWAHQHTTLVGGSVILHVPVVFPGNEMRVIQLPAKRITSCCFGGDKFDELYVTSALFGATDEEKKTYPLAGSVFKVTGLGVNGYPSLMYERV